MTTKTEGNGESKKGLKQTRIVVIVAGLILLTFLYFLANNIAQTTTPPAEPVILSQTVIGFFGYAGEETGVPTTLVLVRVDDYRRILMASSGAEGELVTQAGRFSLANGAMSLSVREINGDEFMDVICGGLILYGGPGGLSVW